MEGVTPISPLERSGDAFTRAKMMSGFLHAHDRPMSVATEATEFEGQEEDLSDVEAQSLYRYPTPESAKRRSQSTIESLNEAPTPESGRGQRALRLELQSVEGPRGPHLFRSSQQSADFAFALQMSPMLPKEMDLQTSGPGINGIILPDQVFDLDTPVQRTITTAEVHTVRRWSSTKVIDWLMDSQMDASVIACFEKHDITGDVLMDLTFDDLRDLGIESFGKRHQLWNVLCILQGRPDEDLSPCQTTFDDISRPATAPPERVFTPIEDGTGKKRRARKPTKVNDVVTPFESVSIVAIEQLMPKLHKCAKGERCAKWRKQQREIQRLQDEHQLGQWPISPTRGGHIFVAGDPGNAATAGHMPQAFAPPPQPDDFYRPTSDAIPSIVASSDLLGPGQIPEFVLQEDMLQQLDKRDPQENVKAFLQFQHLNSPGLPLEDELLDAIVTPKQGSFASRVIQLDPGFEMFPEQHIANIAATHDAQPATRYHQRSQSAQEHRQALPKLDTRADSAQDHIQLVRSATTSPGTVYRFATPASEMDIPVATQAMVPRNTSQSVPPDMQYRQQRPASRSHSRQGKRSRPSAQLEMVREHEILSPSETPRPSMSTQRSGSTGDVSFSTISSRTMSIDPSRSPAEVKVFGYGADCTQAGWMRKRRTKLLRHEWQDAHFRLRGTELAMHKDDRFRSAVKETIDVDQYSVACSTAPTSSKLSAAFKSFAISNSSPEKKEKDATAFAFQLVPEGKDRELFSTAKTHHFAVKSKDERIDWMRELMLAKALQQKRDGYEVEHNGVQT